MKKERVIIHPKRELTITPELYHDLRWLKITLFIALTLFFMTHIIRESSIDRAFYSSELSRLGVITPKSAGTVKAVNSVVQYITEGKSLSGHFSERDRLHMRDVRALYLLILRLEYASISLVILLSYLIFIHKKDEVVKSISHSLVLSGLTLIAVVMLLFTLKSRFSFLFIGFHRLAFSNNYWLLTPGKDLLITLFPEQFFYDLSCLIAKRMFFSGLLLAVIGGASLYYYHLRKI